MEPPGVPGTKMLVTTTTKGCGVVFEWILVDVDTRVRLFRFELKYIMGRIIKAL